MPESGSSVPQGQVGTGEAQVLGTNVNPIELGFKIQALQAQERAGKARNALAARKIRNEQMNELDQLAPELTFEPFNRQVVDDFNTRVRGFIRDSIASGVDPGDGIFRQEIKKRVDENRLTGSRGKFIEAQYGEAKTFFTDKENNPLANFIDQDAAREALWDEITLKDADGADVLGMNGAPVHKDVNNMALNPFQGVIDRTMEFVDDDLALKQFVADAPKFLNEYISARKTSVGEIQNITTEEGPFGLFAQDGAGRIIQNQLTGDFTPDGRNPLVQEMALNHAVLGEKFKQMRDEMGAEKFGDALNLAIKNNAPVSIKEKLTGAQRDFSFTRSGLNTTFNIGGKDFTFKNNVMERARNLFEGMVNRNVDELRGTMIGNNVEAVNIIPSDSEELRTEFLPDVFTESADVVKVSLRKPKDKSIESDYSDRLAALMSEGNVVESKNSTDTNRTIFVAIPNNKEDALLILPELNTIRNLNTDKSKGVILNDDLKPYIRFAVENHIAPFNIFDLDLEGGDGEILDLR